MLGPHLRIVVDQEPQASDQNSFHETSAEAILFCDRVWDGYS